MGAGRAKRAERPKSAGRAERGERPMGAEHVVVEEADRDQARCA